MTEKENGVVYALCEPDTDEIRYIGATKQSPKDRLKAHIYGQTSKSVSEWISGLQNNDKLPDVKVLSEVSLSELAGEERRYVDTHWETCDLLNTNRRPSYSPNGPQTKSVSPESVSVGPSRGGAVENIASEIEDQIASDFAFHIEKELRERGVWHELQQKA